ncbi:MAG: helix-turn-helix domain-containing protein [Clostridia bacterium]|nr:helix-turn-helix domain-containing protein [Clostridia bacterium]
MEYNVNMYGNRIKELRIEKGLSQQQLADRLGTTQKSISKYELEKLDLSTEFIIRLCDYFSVTADFLLGIENVAEKIEQEEK